MNVEPRSRWILPVIVFAQFCGGSLWFAGNAIVSRMPTEWLLGENSVGLVTSFVLFGFISGTLFSAFFMLADRVSPRLVFLGACFLGALTNVIPVFIPPSVTGLLLSRFLTGLFLAGIYPVGMKIAAGWYQQGLGKAMGYLVGALVLGTAFPHWLNGASQVFSWQLVLLIVSVMAVIGGVFLYCLVADGPFLAASQPFNPSALSVIFKIQEFRASAFGYFGHMWELYAFWAFVPIILPAHYFARAPSNVGELVNLSSISLVAFVIIAAGVVGSVGGGHLAEKIGSAWVAKLQLSISGICCLISPVLFFTPTVIYLPFMFIWGMTVVGDSAQFSALNAQTAPRDYIGSALTIVTCLGFFITIFSIQLLQFLSELIAPQWWFLFLLPGPVVGLWAMRSVR